MANFETLLQALIDHQKEQTQAHKEQMQAQKEQHEEQMELQKNQIRIQQKQLNDTLMAHERQIDMLRNQHRNEMESKAALTTFQSFDPNSETWANYLKKFMTFLEANSVADGKQAKIFLTNQSDDTYKILSNLAEQEAPPRDINELSMEDIKKYMTSVFDPTRILVRERYLYWLAMKQRPGETIQELAASTQQDASTCDFNSIKDPLDEALHTRFICSVDNEAVLKALFHVNNEYIGGSMHTFLPAWPEYLF